MTKRTIAVALVATSAGALAGPPVFATAKEAVQEVLVRNTADDPVITKATGTTAVAGTVSLAEGTKVKLSDGSVVGLADNSKVNVGNGADNPIPVDIVGGGAAAAVEEPFGFNRTIAVGPDDTATNHYASGYTVPEGKELVLTAGNGFASEGIRFIGIERRSCFATGGGGLYVYGTQERNGSVGTWHLEGETRAPAGCQLVPYFNVPANRTETVQASFHLFGYLVDA